MVVFGTLWKQRFWRGVRSVKEVCKSSVTLQVCISFLSFKKALSSPSILSGSQSDFFFIGHLRLHGTTLIFLWVGREGSRAGAIRTGGVSEPVFSMGSRHSSVLWVTEYAKQESLVHLLPWPAVLRESSLPVPVTWTLKAQFFHFEDHFVKRESISPQQAPFFFCTVVHPRFSFWTIKEDLRDL